MAKKKKEDYEEEDWFEDDEDLGEEKPKKKAAGKKKEKSYAWVWVAAFIVILIILLLVRYKYASPSADDNVLPEDELLSPEGDEETVYIPESKRTDSASEDDGYVYEEPQEMGDDVVTDIEIQSGDYTQHSITGEPTNEDAEHARDLTEKPELFSNINCRYDYEAEIPYISLRIYNVLDEDILISPKGVSKGYNTYFMIRGIVDKDPGCGTEVLRPGQYTECKRIGFDGKQYANLPGTNRISIEVPKKTEAIIVNCPESPVVVESEE